MPSAYAWIQCITCMVDQMCTIGFAKSSMLPQNAGGQEQTPVQLSIIDV